MKKHTRTLKSQHPSEQSVKTGQSNPVAVSRNISTDPDYILLHTEYQNANWEECNKLLTKLLEKYPANPRLEEFKHDFEFQYSVYKDTKNPAENKNKNTSKSVTKNILIISGIIVVVLALVWGGYSFLRNYSYQRQLQYNAAQFATLTSQVESLLKSYQPDKVNELLQRMKEIDPKNPKILELSQETDQLLQLNALYEDALTKINNSMDVEALVILQNIEKDYPGYRDVTQLIDEAQTRIDVAQALVDATEAYKESRWADAITGFEQVQTLDPSNNNPNLKEMLLNSYLQQIIQMLESDNITIDDIDKAEIYYRRAIALIPQSKTFLNEREDLQKISSNLIELKYSQTALVIINDPNQTQVSVMQALNYLTKASNLNPNDSILQTELANIQLYQVGFQDYVKKNWAAAIVNLQQLIDMDENYANGFAKQLLYEAHVGRGNYYYSIGLYLDARKEYEAAEVLIWDQNNLMNLFFVEVDLGNTLGKLKDFKDAASYFKYTFEAVNYANRASSHSTFVSNIKNAIQLYTAGKYKDSYDLFESNLADNNVLFTEKGINVQMGNCLAFIAAQNQSTVQAILERNDLSGETIISADQTLIIPSMPK